MIDTNKGLLTIVVPVFNETEVLPHFYERTTAVGGQLAPMDYELIFVDDGSRDGSYELLKELSAGDEHVRVLKLSRNFGHQVAITAGIDNARGDCIVVIDSDLQDPPEVIPRMVEKWREGYDVVYGVRSKRPGESAMKLWTAAAFYRLLYKITTIEIPRDAGDFRLLSRRAAAQLSGMRENDRYVRGLVSWLGFRQFGLEYERDARYAGETKYPYKKMVKFALDGITSFSTVPLKIATWMGYAASGFAFLYLFSVFVQRAMGVTVEGWATIMVALTFLGGVQLVCIGIVGEYIGRIFTEIKGRPMYILEENLERQSGNGSRPQVVRPGDGARNEPVLSAPGRAEGGS